MVSVLLYVHTYMVSPLVTLLLVEMWILVATQVYAYIYTYTYDICIDTCDVVMRGHVWPIRCATCSCIYDRCVHLRPHCAHRWLYKGAQSWLKDTFILWLYRCAHFWLYRCAYCGCTGVSACGCTGVPMAALQ